MKDYNANWFIMHFLYNIALLEVNIINYWILRFTPTVATAFAHVPNSAFKKVNLMAEM